MTDDREGSGFTRGLPSPSLAVIVAIGGCIIVLVVAVILFA